MEHFKDSESQIVEIDNYLEKFDKKIEDTMKTVKQMTINDLKNDLKTYQKEWKTNYNDILVKKNKKNIDKLEFSDAILKEGNTNGKN